MMFYDEAKVIIRSGKGGDGCVSFLREKFREFGGPNGGDGGAGGGVYACCVDGLNTLADYRFQKHVFAKNGVSGAGRHRSGQHGSDAELHLPRGTQVLSEGELLADVTEVGQRVLIARGGRGGLGNMHFRSSTNRAPRQSTPGQPGIEMELVLRLKLFADVGIIGLPNAGKSSFLSRISEAHPKVADYPFTTLNPVLGTVDVDDNRFVVADIPGLIEGASQGSGLGSRFLRHIERCRLLLHLIEGVGESEGTISSKYHTIRNELGSHSQSVADKLEIVAVSKADAMTVEQRDQALQEIQRIAPNAHGWGVISSLSGLGIKQLLRQIAEITSSQLDSEAEQSETQVPV